MKRNKGKIYEELTAYQNYIKRRRVSKNVNIIKYSKFLEFLYNNFDKKTYGIDVLIKVARKIIYSIIFRLHKVYTIELILDY